MTRSNLVEAEHFFVRTPADDDKHKPMPDNDSMNGTLTRPELDAKLATIEAKMDGRLARIEDKFASIDRRFDSLQATLADQKSTAWKAAGATIAVTVGTIVAAFALSFGAFDSGRETAKLAAEAQAKATQAQQDTANALSEIRQIVSGMKAQTGPQTPPQ